MSVSRLPTRCLRVTVPYLRQSTLASSRLRPVVRPAQSMGTWTDRLRRWQSGTRGDKEKKNNTAVESPEADTESVSPQPQEAACQELESVVREKEEVIKKQEEKITELQDKYLRALADAENVRQRMTKLVEEAKLFGIQGFSKDILEVADILERATESVPKSELEESANPHLFSLFEGLKMTETELQKVFKKNGLQKIDPLGEVFDPVFHEALFEVPGDKPGVVAVVSGVGYVLNGRTIRPARVGVYKVMENS